MNINQIQDIVKTFIINNERVKAFDFINEGAPELITQIGYYGMHSNNAYGLQVSVPQTFEFLYYLIMDLNIWLQGLSKRFNKNIPVQLFLIDSPRFRVSAFKKGEHELIGVSYGALHILKFLFNRIMSDRNLMTHIGDPNLEEQQSITWNNYQDIILDNRIDLVVFPKDYTRALYAIELTKLAIYYLVAHEFSHICNGHLSWKSNKSGENEAYIKDNIDEKISAKGNREKQSMEVDADVSAFNFSVIRVLVDREKRLRNLLEQDLLGVARSGFEAAYGSDLNFLRSFTFSMNVLFRIQDMYAQRTLNRDNIFKSTHPPFKFRAMAIHRLIDNSFNNYAISLDRNLLIDTIRTTMRDAHQAVSQITNASNHWSVDIWADDGKKLFNEYVAEISEAWRNLRGSLEGYRRTP